MTQQILFFDSDSLLTHFIRKHPVSEVTPVFFRESLNTAPLNKVEPYRDVEIISLFTHSEVVLNERLDLFPSLKLIATRSTGVNHIDLEYCKRRGITVVNVPKYGEATVAEFSFGLLLALARQIIRAKNDMAHNRIEMSNYMGYDLQGKTIGIIGTGSIGRHMIQLAQGFNMKVLAFDKYPAADLKKFYAKDLKSIFKRADIISLHIPSTPENFHLLDEEAFRLMKKGVIIINTARGDLIDTQALYQALKSGKVGAAGLDVLENEDFLLHDEVATAPHMKDSAFLLDSAMNLKLLQFRNVIATPHIAFNSIDAISRINATTLENIRLFLERKPQNVIV